MSFDVRDLIACDNGTKIVFSSIALEKNENGKLFIFDAQAKKLIGEFVPLAGENDTGKIIEVSPGVVVGVVSKSPKSKIYKVDLKNMKLIWHQEIEGKAFGGVRSFDRRLTKGPDGHLWFYIDNHICRLEPQSGKVEKVLAAPPAGNLLFWNDKLIIYGHEDLRLVSW